MNMHGLRATTVTLLLKAGHADSSVAMRTRHRDVRSLKSYQNLAGSLEKRLREDVFGISPSKKLTVREIASTHVWNDEGLRGEGEGARYGKSDLKGKENNLSGPTGDSVKRESHGQCLSLLSNLDGLSRGNVHCDVGKSLLLPLIDGTRMRP